MKITAKKSLIITIALIFLLVGCYKLANFIGPGSYPYVETYEIDYPENQVIVAVKAFKADNPEYVVPDVNLLDGRRDSLDYWYHIYFFYKKEGIIFKTWLRPSTRTKTTFALSSINKEGDWLMVNKDLTSSENDKIKEIFETKILRSIKANLIKQQNLKTNL